MLLPDFFYLINLSVRLYSKIRVVVDFKEYTLARISSFINGGEITTSLK
jgi:hypothetical protein